MIDTIQALQQHELVILRRLLKGPLTEFELVTEIVGHSGHKQEHVTDKLPDWLRSLREEGLIWAGPLENASGQSMYAAALTRKGRDLLN